MNERKRRSPKLSKFPLKKKVRAILQASETGLPELAKLADKTMELPLWDCDFRNGNLIAKTVNWVQHFFLVLMGLEKRTDRLGYWLLLLIKNLQALWVRKCLLLVVT